MINAKGKKINHNKLVKIAKPIFLQTSCPGKAVVLVYLHKLKTFTQMQSFCYRSMDRSPFFLSFGMKNIYVCLCGYKLANELADRKRFLPEGREEELQRRHRHREKKRREGLKEPFYS